MSTEASGTHDSSAGARKGRTRLLLLIAAAAVVVAVGSIAGVVVSRGDDSIDVDTAAGAQQLASIQRACTQWHGGYTGSVAPPRAWCTDMVGWMADQMRHRPMASSTMWGDRDQMLATCKQWMSSRTGASGSTPDTSAWCGQMVVWMTQYMGDSNQWDQGWMMNGPMMG